MPKVKSKSKAKKKTATKKKVKKTFWDVYVIQTRSGRLYTGIALSKEKRFLEHKNDPKKGAKFFRSDPPLKIVYSEKKKNRSEATKREREIKSLSRKEKLILIKSKT
jgi:putative endonuclease